MKNQNIERLANDIVGQADLGTIPIDVVGIAMGLGLNVTAINLGEGISGVLVMNEHGGAIGYNMDHAPVRQRFTIAHEIGHFVLHKDAADLFVDKSFSVAFRSDRSSSGEDKREREANAFASALLMPESHIRSEISRMGFDLAEDISLANLARKFGVSKQSMSYRLASLGLF